MRSADELAVQMLRRGEPLRIRARGGSMLPFIWDGSVALVTPAAASDIVVGDVICYETSPSRLFVHRVIQREGDRLIVKGDALSWSETIDPTQLLGKVIAIERRRHITRADSRIARWSNRLIVSITWLIPPLVSHARQLRRFIRAAGVCAR